MPNHDVTIEVVFKSKTAELNSVVFDTHNACTLVTASTRNRGTTVERTTSGDACLRFTTKADTDPYIFVEYKNWGVLSASTYKYMVITAKVPDDAPRTNAMVYPAVNNVTSYDENFGFGFDLIKDGEWHDYVFDFSSCSGWTGNINALRFDYYNGSVAAGKYFYLRSIQFFSSSHSIPTITTDKTEYIVGQPVKLTYSGLKSYVNTNQTQDPFISIYDNGKDPGNGSARLYKHVSSTGTQTITFPSGAQGGTQSTSSDIPVGTYYAWVAYDGYGTTNAKNLNNVEYSAITVYPIHLKGEDIYQVADRNKASYKFTVRNPKVTLSTSGSGGSVSLKNGSSSFSSGSQAAPGTTITVAITVNSGYKATYSINGGTSTTITASKNVTFDVVAGKDNTVSVTFAKQSYTMTLTQPSNGTITVTDSSGNPYSNGASIPYNTALTIKLKPSSGYRVKNIKAGKTSGTISSIKDNTTISDAEVTGSYNVPNGNFTITADACIKYYAVSKGSVTNGSISVTTGNVDKDTDLTITAKPNTGYRVNTITTKISGTTKAIYTNSNAETGNK